jgi:bacterial/archaeal transporter family-2 protein
VRGGSWQLVAFPSLAALFVGGLTAIQSRANGSLADALGSGLQAATLSFATGLLITTLIVITSKRLRMGVRTLVASIRNADLRVWELFGGFSGAFFVLSQSVSVPVIGVALFSIAVVSGQSSSALIVDRLGLGPHGRQPMTRWRVLSALIGLSAVFVAVSGGVDQTQRPPTWLVIMCFVAGVGISIQQAINGRVSKASGEPLVAAWLNFITGTSILLAALLLMSAVRVIDITALPSGPVWLYIGGFVGVIFIATTAWVVGKIGVLRLSLLAIAGQLVGSLLLDLFVNGELEGSLIAGVLLAFAAVSVNAIRRPISRTID